MKKVFKGVTDAAKKAEHAASKARQAAIRAT